MGKTAKIKVIFYISPQFWAWKETGWVKWRKILIKMIVFFLWKKLFKTKWNWDVEYVGHPLVEIVESYRSGVGSQSPQSAVEVDSRQLATIGKLTIHDSLLTARESPNRRLQKKLPVMLEVSKHFPQYQFVVAEALLLKMSLWKFHKAILKCSALKTKPILY